MGLGFKELILGVKRKLRNALAFNCGYKRGEGYFRDFTVWWGIYETYTFFYRNTAEQFIARQINMVHIIYWKGKTNEISL